MYSSSMIFSTIQLYTSTSTSDGWLLDIIFMNVVYVCPLTRQGKKCVTSFSQNCDLVESAVDCLHFYQIDTDLLLFTLFSSASLYN